MPKRKYTKSKRIDPLKGLKVSDFKLLEYPPNEGTWRCTKLIATKEDGTEVYCKMVNSQHQETCVICRNARENGTLLWPIYVKLCERLNIIPGEQLFRLSETGRPIIKDRKGGKWATWENSQ